jgi:hypothetical protein
MLEIRYTMIDEHDLKNGEKITGERTFETFKDLENWLAYHRAYLVSVEFEGQLENDRG